MSEKTNEVSKSAEQEKACPECKGTIFSKRFDGSLICVNCKYIIGGAKEKTGKASQEKPEVEEAKSEGVDLKIAHELYENVCIEKVKQQLVQQAVERERVEAVKGEMERIYSEKSCKNCGIDTCGMKAGYCGRWIIRQSEKV